MTAGPSTPISAEEREVADAFMPHLLPEDRYARYVKSRDRIREWQRTAGPLRRALKWLRVEIPHRVRKLRAKYGEA